MYKAICALYRDPQARVILNKYTTDYFICTIGTKQGDSLSPTLFSTFINDLSQELTDSGVGIVINKNINDDEEVSDDELIVNNLLYADDLICLAESEEDLQFLINIVDRWGKRWRLEVNLIKTNVMHVRPPKSKLSEYVFKLGNSIIMYCTNYRYLGTHINEFLDFDKMISEGIGSASRALGTIICKMKKNGGFPLNTYKLLIESCVESISDYCAEVLGFKKHPAIDEIHCRAIRVFLGIKKTAPTWGIKAEMGWMEPQSRAHLKMIRYFLHISNLPDSRITKKVFLHDISFSNYGTNDCWATEVSSVLHSNGLGQYCSSPGNKQVITTSLKVSLLNSDKQKFYNNCFSLPKLRTYIKVTNFSEENIYIFKALTFSQKSHLAKFKLGVLEAAAKLVSEPMQELSKGEIRNGIVVM